MAGQDGHIAALPIAGRRTFQMDSPLACPSAYVVYGDTLRCGSLRLRPPGADVPELPGHCPNYRQCVPGDGFASTHSLVEAICKDRLTYSIVTTDRFGRPVVMAWAGRVNLSCWQLQRAAAVYVPRWDNDKLVASAFR